MIVEGDGTKDNSGKVNTRLVKEIVSCLDALVTISRAPCTNECDSLVPKAKCSLSRLVAEMIE
jgi:hypothetical protein